MKLPKELEELKDLKQWVCYKNVWDEKKQKNKKIPKDANTGRGAKANDPETWSPYSVAIAGKERLNLDGVGFEFASGYLGIDLDNVIDEQGHLLPVASEIVELMDSYTEYSPSGKGLHILCKTSLGEIGRRNDEIGLEMYNHGRFFTITGKPYGEPKAIQERTEQVKEIYKRYLHKPQKEDEVKPVQKGQLPPSTVESSFENLLDSDLWQRMFDSPKGSTIRALYSGDTSGYSDDHSRADQALVNHLAYWTNCDVERIDRMFRQSGLHRGKWDEKRGQLTYGERTIAVAVKSVVPFSSVRSYSLWFGTDKKKAPAVSLVKDGAKGSESVTEYIHDVLARDLERFQSFKDRKTGFSNIDEVIGCLYPGLYVLGAISSLGKTTFVHQLGDQLARGGDHVLFFSLEQSRFEMVTKGMSRLTAQENLKTAVSAIDIRQGVMTDAVQRAAETYAGFAEHETIIECDFNTTIETITGTVEEYIKQTKVVPVVIVDYLQIIQPMEKGSTKDAVDGHVKALKKLQMNHDLVLIVISSLNRQNYLTPIDFESFKESGGIEYTADVIWGLQLQVMNEEMFNHRENVKEKRDKVKSAKRAEPRKIELVCLKNRYGVSSYTCGFDYYASYDYLKPDEKFKEEIGEGQLAFRVRRI